MSDLESLRQRALALLAIVFEARSAHELQMAIDELIGLLRQVQRNRGPELGGAARRDD